MHTEPPLEPTCLFTCENEEDGRTYRRNPLQHHCALPIGRLCIFFNWRFGSHLTADSRQRSNLVCPSDSTVETLQATR